MKIIAIRGRNLASLEGDFEIDFTAEPLLSAGIFAISGPTGAGKSTLLDAMCLALFARTPRTDQAKENNVRLRDVNDEVLPQSDPRFLLRRGTASGYAEVDFEALNGNRYRARWSVSRARDKENGRLQNPRVSLFNLDKGEEEQGTRSDLQARIIELIGLTFEQFTRSVLLAQNDFSTFLKAEQGEKASLLEKLTGTELYSSISRLIFEKNTKAKEAYDAVHLRIQGVELLTEEQETEFRARLAEVDASLLRLQKQKQEQQALQEAVRSAEQQIIAKQKQQKEAVDRLSHATGLLEIVSHDYKKGVEEQQQADTYFKSLQQDLLQARKLDVQLETAKRDLSLSEEQVRKASENRLQAEDNHQKSLIRLQQSVTEAARLTDWREKYKSKEGIAEQFSTLLLHLDAASAARNAVDKANHLLLSIRQDKERLQKQLADLQTAVAKKRMEASRTEDAYRKLEEELKGLDQVALDHQIELIRRERERLLIEQAHDVRELRAKLEDDIPCPVCGSVHHPYADASLAPTNEAVMALTLQLETLSKRKDAHASDTRKLLELQQQLLRFHKELSENETACKDITGKQELIANRQEHEETLVKEQSVKLSQSLSAADGLFGSSDWQKGWLQNPDVFRKTLTDFVRLWQENGEKLRELERLQSAFKAECDSLASFLPSVRKQQEDSLLVQEKNRIVFTSLQTERMKLLEGKPADAVEQHAIRRMEELKERLQKLLAVQTEQSSIAEQMRGITEQITKDLAEITSALSGHQAALDKWNTDYHALSEGQPLDTVLVCTTQEQTELSFRLRTHVENQAKVASLQEELTARRADSECWAKLNELAGSADGAKFRRIAQGYTLDVLLSYANVQLRDLSRRYRLERVPETLALQVIDRDMCDEIRSVHSLSGGESFLVSLALALGLSSLSSNRMKVESLFIDEGFGSLDAETLRTAMDALENLRTQGRKIGVISHVQEMTERIPVQILVSRAGNGRSFLEVK